MWAAGILLERPAVLHWRIEAWRISNGASNGKTTWLSRSASPANDGSGISLSGRTLLGVLHPLQAPLKGQGGSDLRYSFDIRRGKVGQEVGADARDWCRLEKQPWRPESQLVALAMPAGQSAMSFGSIATSRWTSPTNDEHRDPIARIAQRGRAGLAQSTRLDASEDAAAANEVVSESGESMQSRESKQAAG
jgi:hypothetical protein